MGTLAIIAIAWGALMILGVIMFLTVGRAAGAEDELMERGFRTRISRAHRRRGDRRTRNEDVAVDRREAEHRADPTWRDF